MENLEPLVMAKLYFYYSAMNAGKSTTLLQAAWNYREQGMLPLLLTPQLNTRDGKGRIASRIGLHAEAMNFNCTDSLIEIIRRSQQENSVSCIMVDEAQFLSKRQVAELGEIADIDEIPVMAFGLRTDFQGNLFEGSQFLLAWADVISEIKTICHCGRKATMVLRVDQHRRAIRGGEQIHIGGNESYVSVCRRHFREGIAEQSGPMLPFSDPQPD
jgi:thymidine kinase